MCCVVCWLVWSYLLPSELIPSTRILTCSIKYEAEVVIEKEGVSALGKCKSKIDRMTSFVPIFHRENRVVWITMLHIFQNFPRDQRTSEWTMFSGPVITSLVNWMDCNFKLVPVFLCASTCDQYSPFYLKTILII